MGRLTQAPHRENDARRHARAVRIAIGFGFALLGAGCGAASLKLADSEVDRSLTTATVPSATAAADPDRRSDEATIRNAVSSADIAVPGAAPLAWANTDTGSRGSISKVIQTNQNGVVCRKFTTTRESFDGIALFNGETCMMAPGAWQLTAFGPS